MPIPLIDGLTPDDIVEPVLAPDGTRCKITINGEPQICKAKDKVTGVDSDREYLKIFTTITEAPSQDYIGTMIVHMVMIPSLHWHKFHEAKDGPDKADKLMTGYRQKYAKWLRQTIQVPADQADTSLYPGKVLDVIVGLEQSDEFGDKNTIKRILD